ncbi:MAG: hypothetical protein ACK5WS_02900 [Alphaproteobacteria bacterium]|jgi:Ran GTPase-activating protein (RanGAP) involved in mRNA processing and transport|nr:hypothetical protein [Candidatus Jidaibacter sp.]
MREYGSDSEYDLEIGYNVEMDYFSNDMDSESDMDYYHHDDMRSDSDAVDSDSSMDYSSEDVTEFDYDEAINMLIKNDKSCAYLDLSSQDICDDGADKLADAMRNNTTLRVLNLNANNIRSYSVPKLCESLLHNFSLVELDLSNNSFGICYNKAIKALTKLLKTNISIRTLKLSSIKLNFESASILAKGLSHNTMLKVLDLSVNNIGAKGLSSIIKALNCNQTIRHINLSNTSIAMCVGTAFQRLFNIGHRKMSINLSYNAIVEEEMIEFASFLSNDSSIDNLDLTESNIQDDGMANLCQALKTNMGIVCLDASYNPVGSKGLYYLAELLRSNTVLQSISYLQTGERESIHRTQGLNNLEQAILDNENILYAKYDSMSHGVINAMKHRANKIKDIIELSKSDVFLSSKAGSQVLTYLPQIKYMGRREDLLSLDELNRLMDFMFHSIHEVIGDKAALFSNVPGEIVYFILDHLSDNDLSNFAIALCIAKPKGCYKPNDCAVQLCY